MKLVDRASGAVVVPELRPAHTHWTRMKGLLGSTSLPSGEGLWIKPCNQVHMYFMRYAVDLIFLDRELRVVKLIENQPVNTLSSKIADAESVVEVPVGTIAASGLREGATLSVDGAPEIAPEASLLESLGALGGNLLMAGFYAIFVLNHVRMAQRYDQWSTAMPIVLQEALLVFLFLTRRRSKEVSSRPLDWIMGIAGTAFPLFFRPTPEVSNVAWFAQPIQVLGLALAVLGTISLGRSVGIVAGNRGVKTAGMHGIVRHPMYMGYLVGYIAYVFVYPSPYNVAIIIGTILALNYRAIAEERFLQRDPAYQEYLQRVRWRFVPFVY